MLGDSRCCWLHRLSAALLFLANVSYADLSRAACPNPPSPPLPNFDHWCTYLRFEWTGSNFATGYKLWKRPDDHTDPPITDPSWTLVATTSQAYADVQTSTLPAHASVIFKVEAFNSDEPSCPRAVSDGWPVWAPYLPVTPTNVHAVALTESQIKVTWTPLSFPPNHRATIYRDNESTPIRSDVNYALGEDTFPGICGSHTYYVQAVTSDGCSSPKIPTNAVPTSPSTPIHVAPVNGAVVTTPDATLSWSANCAGSYSIEIADNSAFTSPLVSTTPTTPTYTWPDAPIGTFWWHVRSQSSSGVSNWSAPSWFEHPLAVTVTYPNGGETLYMGDLVNLTWTTSASVPSVNLEYSTDSGIHWGPIASGVPNAGSYPWTVPMAPTQHGLVRVSSGSYSDVSNASFTIATAPLGSAALEWSRDWITKPAWEPSFVLAPGQSARASFQSDPYGLYSDLVVGYRQGPCAWNYDVVESGLDCRATPSSSYQAGVVSALASGPQQVLGAAYLDKPATPSYELQFKRGTRRANGSYQWSSFPKGTHIANISAVTCLSIAFDAAGTAHIVYNSGAALQYVTVSPTLVVSVPVTISTLPQAGQEACSIAIDAAGNPCVAFSIISGPTAGDVSLGYARRSNGTWTPPAGQRVAWTMGLGARLALDGTGQPRIACVGLGVPGLMYVKWTGSSWSFTNVLSSAIDGNLALALDGAGLAHLAVWSQTGSLATPTYVRERASTPHWEASVFDTAAGYPSVSPLGIGLDSDGGAMVGYATKEGTRNCLELAQGRPGAPDVTSPAAVTSLTVNMGKTTAAPYWVEPGDDGASGSASYYDVRYSTLPILGETQFASATPMVSTGCPAPAGWGDCATAIGLASCSPYYFAVKVRDNAGNWSPLSNVAYGVTKCSGPEVVCDPGGEFSNRPADEADGTFAPPALALSLVSPNPIRGSAGLLLDVPTAEVGGRAHVAVYDAQGRRVRTVLDELATSGRHAMNWDLRGDDGNRVRSGVYFVRLQLEARSIVRSLIVLD